MKKASYYIILVLIAFSSNQVLESKCLAGGPFEDESNLSLRGKRQRDSAPNDRFIPSRREGFDPKVQSAKLLLQPEVWDESIKDSDNNYLNEISLALFGKTSQQVKHTPILNNRALHSIDYKKERRDWKARIASRGYEPFLSFSHTYTGIEFGFDYRKRKISFYHDDVLVSYKNHLLWGKLDLEATQIKNWTEIPLELQGDIEVTLAFFAGPNQILLGLNDGSLSLLEIRGQQILQKVLLDYEIPAIQAQVVPNRPTQLAVLDSAGYVQFLEKQLLNLEKNPFSSDLHPFPCVEVFSISPDSRFIALGTSNGLEVRRLGGEILYSTPQDQKFSVTAVAWHPSTPILAFGGGMADGKIRILDTRLQKIIDETSFVAQVTSLKWSTDGEELISSHGFHENKIFTWAFEKYKDSWKLALVAQSPSFSKRVLQTETLNLPDNNTLTLSTSEDQTLRFWKVTKNPQKQIQSHEFAKGKHPRGIDLTIR